MTNRSQVAVSGAFDDLRSRQVRLLEEASRVGEVNVLLWSDAVVQTLTGKPPRFSQAERLYSLQAIRYVARVHLIEKPFDLNTLPDFPGAAPNVWVADPSEANPARERFCHARGVQFMHIAEEALRAFPAAPLPPPLVVPGRKRVIVTGCYDWFHSGHVRFFEEVSGYGDLYVVVGHDENIRMLKGLGHPLLPQDERRYVVGSIRFVTQALVSTGHGWLDAEPEIQRIKPDIYAVNEDGDKGGKRDYCAAHGIEYLVLKRTPAPGLPPRSSTVLRGF